MADWAWFGLVNQISSRSHKIQMGHWNNSLVVALSFGGVPGAVSTSAELKSGHHRTAYQPTLSELSSPTFQVDDCPGMGEHNKCHCLTWIGQFRW